MPMGTRERWGALRRLLEAGELGTQDELREELVRQKFQVTQSTISRDLRRVGAVKAVDALGRTVYRLPGEILARVPAGSLAELISRIESNRSMVVIHTSPGSASLIARHLDHARPAGILGTIAGDDTIFVAPSPGHTIRSTVQAIEQCLESKV